MSGAQDGAIASSSSRDFTVVSQRLALEIDLATQSLKGTAEIVISPHSKDLRTIRLNGRQCRITYLTVEGKAVTLKQHDPYILAKPHPSFDVHQHHLLRGKIEGQLKNPPEEELIIVLPKSLQIKELDPFSAAVQDSLSRTVKTAAGAAASAETPATATASEQATQFANLHIVVRWEVIEARDGLQWVGLQDGDSRYPHVFTRNSPFPGKACSIFPCVDDPTVRCPWEISIKVPRTLGDAFRSKNQSSTTAGLQKPSSSQDFSQQGLATGMNAFSVDGDSGLSEREMALELCVICSGNMEEAEILFSDDPTRKSVSFVVESAVSANQIGFAIGPFQAVELSQFREIDDDEKLGAQAIRVHGFCLPGRADEVRNTCMPLAKALDFFTTTYTAYPGGSYKLCFVDDLDTDTVTTIGLCICSTRLLFPEDIIEPLDIVTRKLIRALAEQYAGISLAPRESSDTWVVAGMASFMADVFMKHLSGNNEYRYQQKTRSDRVHDLDVERPSLYILGTILHIDRSEADFLALKAGVVLFILDRRLTKSSGSTGVGRIIGRILTNAKAADVDSTMISTAQFQRQCEKMGHIKLDTFFQQWVYGAGCPTFYVTQRFNKKKLVVEMLIRQSQSEKENVTLDLDPSSFLRDVKEDNNEVYAGTIQPVFTGPMTIRIHEADGTPYEHIVDIKDASTKFEIPYNTKYKRLKRSKRQRDRVAATVSVEDSMEVQDEALLYCLGDVLQSQDEVFDWRLSDWSKEDEDRMSQESYEWIRMDADFEWICKMNISMPPYMFVSQLQQDRDVVAQMETLQYMAAQKEHPLISTILTRTIMDRRYFYGIRVMAVAGLIKCAKDELDWIGYFHLEKIFQELFCFPGSPMPRPNDFSDRVSLILQCAIPKAISQIKSNRGQAPMRVQKFLFDKLKFNDNTDNEFSDVYYVATLMSGLAKSLTSPDDFDFDDEDEDDYAFRKEAVGEIERYRRIDEWISSYQNTYSVTALDCLLHLAQSGVVPPKLRDFLQYTRPGNSDMIRIKALDCLMDLGMLRNNAIFRYFLYMLSTDPSPYVRENTYRIFGRGLGKLAIGVTKEGMKASSPAIDGLIIEQDTSTEARQADLARRQTIPGAIAALRKEIGDNDVVKQALWAAISSPIISLDELSNLLDICTALYEPRTSLLLVFKYPLYWQVQHVGKCVLRFTKTGHVRNKELQPIQWPIASTSITPAKPIPSTLLFVSKPPKASPALSRKPSTITLNPSVAAVPPAAPGVFETPAATTISLQPSLSFVANDNSVSPALKDSTSPSPPLMTLDRRQHILKLKFKGPLPPNPPAKVKASVQPSGTVADVGGVPRSSSSATAHGAHGLIRLSTPISARSPSPLPLTGTGSLSVSKTLPVDTSHQPAHKHGKHAKHRKGYTPASTPLSIPKSVLTSMDTASSPAPSSKKRKNSTSTERGAANDALISAANGEAKPPLAKKPTLKIKLGFGGSGTGAGTGSPAGK